jgi:ER lumen protein retaining receptor
VAPQLSYWNFVLKNFYIWSSLYILLLQLRVYPRTREREKAWQLGIFAAGGSLLAAPLITPIFRKFTFIEVLYTFSLILESVCILPQLLLLRQTTVPTVITSFYLLTLGSYRFFYILNWIYKVAKPHPNSQLNPVSVIFGIVQTALYVDFAWVYWTRQRVKLRGGGVVDSDDLRKSWFVGGLLGGVGGRASADQGRGGIDDEDESYGDIEDQPRGGAGLANGNARKSTAPNRWGKRGVSVSADDTLEEHEQSRVKQPQQQRKTQTAHATEGGTAQERTGMLKQPAEFEDTADNNDDDDDDDDPLFSDDDPDAKPVSSGHHQAVLNSGEAWSDDGVVQAETGTGGGQR